MSLAFRGAVAIVGILLVAGPLRGTTITLPSESFGPQAVSWGVTNGAVNGTVALSFQQFNPSQGSLTAVTITLGGSVTSDMFVANLDAKDAAITAQAQATLTLTRPDLTTLVVTVPTKAVSQVLPRPHYIPGPGETPNDPKWPQSFVDQGSTWVGIGPVGNSNDDKINFASPSLSGPTSGVANPNTIHQKLTANASNSKTFTNPSDLSLFTGTGTIRLPLGAVGQGGVTDTANAYQAIVANATGTVTVQYTYASPGPIPGPLPVPEPASLLSSMIGVLSVLIGLGLQRRQGS